MFRKSLLHSAIAGSLVATAVVPPVLAAGSSVLEEVVVTATRREESAQDVALPVTAVSGDVLERQFAQDARDLNGIAPNVQLQPVGAFQNAAAFYIRGVGSSDIESATDPGIATFIDEVYQGRVSTALQDFVDVSAVEVLRGPQGTLFGRNAIGGVVHLRHNDPSLEGNDWGVGVLVGQEQRFDIRFMGNVAVNDKLAFRLAGKRTSADGFYRNQTPGAPDVNGQDRITLFPSMKYQINDNWDLVIRGEYNRTRDDSWANVPYSACRTNPATGTAGNDVIINVIRGIGGADEAAAFCGQEVSNKSFKVRHDQPLGSFSDFDVWGTTARLNGYFDGLGTMTYIGSYRNVEEDVVNDFDTSDYNLFHTRRIQDHYQLSHELRFTSDFSDAIDVVAGAYYFEQEYEMDQFTYGALVGGGPIFGNSKQLNEAWALFANVDWHINDKLTVTGGLRYSDETKDFDHCGVGFGDPVTRQCARSFGGPVISTLLSKSKDWNAFSPKLGVSYFLADDIMVYGSWARGFRSGGFNGRGNTESSVGPFDEETADNYEIGIKADLLDNRLRLNASAFFMDYDDLQRAAIRPAPGAAGQETVTDNVGAAENKGVELEVTALVTDNFTVNFTAGYLKAENKEWCAAVLGVQATNSALPGFTQCGDPVTVTAPGGGVAGFLVPIDVTNLPPAQSPKWQTRLDLIYDFDLGDNGTLTAVGTWFYRAKNTIVSAGLPAGTLDGINQYNGEYINPWRDASHIFDASLNWRSMDARWRVSGFVKNITNELYPSTGTFVAGLFNFTQMNNPRNWGLELAYNL
ncbi:MAG: TonB-dependent receptor [Pseudomonadales bacterium]|nr:TonB-dependent receptor [Pseudomonadales bacterium]